MNYEKMIATVRYVMSLLVEGEYNQIETLTSGVRMSALELKEEVEGNEQKLVMPPDSFFERIYKSEDNHFVVIEIEDAVLPQWHVTVDLWTDQDEFADISLEMVVTESNETIYDVQIDNLHML